MPIRVTNEKDEVIFEGKLDEGGELTFKKPEGVFSVTFDGGPGHMLTVKSSEIKWPSVPKLVDSKVIGSAYALIFWIQNIGLWLFPLLIGKVLNASNPEIVQPNFL